MALPLPSGRILPSRVRRAYFVLDVAWGSVTAETVACSSNQKLLSFGLKYVVLFLTYYTEESIYLLHHHILFRPLEMEYIY